LDPGEEVVWRCAAGRQGDDGVWLAAGDLYVTQARLILQPARWAEASHRDTVSYALGDCASFQRGDPQRIGRYPTAGGHAWKRMRLELATGETVELAVRRPNKAAEVISRAIHVAHGSPTSAPR
jgi:hypothetical protein